MKAAAKSWGVTLNDLFLAAILLAVSPLATGRSRSSRRHWLSVASIVNTRAQLGDENRSDFGLSLGSFRVAHEVPPDIGLEALARAMQAQTDRAKRSRSYLATPLQLAVARFLFVRSSPARRPMVYAKHQPLWAGLTNLNLNALWKPVDGSAPPDYFRAVSTGPATPLVFSITTAGDRLNVGLSFRTAVFSKSDVERVQEVFQATADEALNERMNRPGFYLEIVGLALLLAGCGTYPRPGVEPSRGAEIESELRQQAQPLPRELEDRILALNPLGVSDRDIRDVLASAPAPRIILIHGGISRVIPYMESFGDFLIGMGYPARSIINPGDGTYTFSCYESARIVAGSVAWYYEKEGLRPMMLGHSQGAFQVVKVLQKLEPDSRHRIAVWNPVTWKEEDRSEITDPLSGKTRPVVGLTLPYASALSGGGLTRFLPNQWGMTGRLRSIPDSVEEFTDFYKHNDLLGGDFLGYGSLNHSHADGTAVVRNVRLPTEYKHGSIPDTRHLLATPELREWINDFDPAAAARRRAGVRSGQPQYPVGGGCLV